MKPFVFEHVDMRVRDWQTAVDFYDVVLAPLGLTRLSAEPVEWTEYRPPTPGWSGPRFTFTVDPQMIAGSIRICFAAESRAEVDAVAEAARRAKASDVELADGLYGPAYRAVFFSDPDGNKLEAGYDERDDA